MKTLALAGALHALLAASALADSPVFVLSSKGGALQLERQDIPDGQTRTWTFGQDGFIDVIAATGPGGSGSVVQAASHPIVEASSAGGRLTLVTRTADGTRYERPIATPEQLAALDTRVSARTGNGASWCGFIRGNAVVQVDPIGPVEDMFAGQIPLAADDCSLSTNTFAARASASAALQGSTPIRMVGGHHVAAARAAGTAGDVVIDLAAGTTVMLRDALPPGTAIEASVMTQYSPQGVKRLAAEIGGATGSTTPAGVAVIPELIVGGIHFKDASVLVMDELPPVGDGTVIGILGIDLLARARSVTFSGQAGAAESMTLGAESAATGGVVVPLSVIGDRTYACAVVNGKEVCLVVDTGSPITILDESAAKAAGIIASGDAEQVRGLGAEKSALSVCTAKSLALGGLSLKDVPVRVGALPIFATLRAGKPVGILGNDVLSRFASVRLDFERSELVLVR